MSKVVHPTPPKFAEIFSTCFSAQNIYDSKKIFSFPDSAENFWAPFQVTMKIYLKKICYHQNFGQKNTQKYVFNVKFFAEHIFLGN